MPGLEGSVVRDSLRTRLTLLPAPAPPLPRSYLSRGGDFFDMLAPLPTLYDSSTPLDQILSEHLQLSGEPVDTQVDGRIVNCGEDAGSPLCTGGSGAPRTSRRALLL